MSKKNFLPLLLMAVAVVAIFIFVVSNNRTPQQQQKQVNLNQGKEVDTSNWQIYRSEYFGIEFSYPLNHDIFDRLEQQGNSSNIPWYQKSDFLLTSLNFNDTSNIDMNLRSNIFTTI